MPAKSSIEWTESTWNPVTGCSKVSPGCKNCYAERMAARLQAMGHPSYRDGFRVTLQPQVLDAPLRWRKPQVVFVNSMSDLFHPEVPDEYILRVFEVMARAEQHQFQILTKRPERVLAMDAVLLWRPNMWMGTSVEDADRKPRIGLLRQTSARIRFLSIEPLLGPLGRLSLKGIHWVIVGGESGPRARPMEQDWVVSIKAQCERAEVPFFFKQWGGVNKKRTGRELLGRTWDAMPAVA